MSKFGRRMREMVELLLRKAKLFNCKPTICGLLDIRPRLDCRVFCVRGSFSA
jgi:hypothetical protein